MPVLEPLVLWMEHNHLEALSKVLAAPGYGWYYADMELVMQEKLDKLYESEICPEERQRIDALCKKLEAGQNSPTKAQRRDFSHWTVCRIVEHGRRDMMTVYNSFDLLEMTRATDCYRKGTFALLKPKCMVDCMGDLRILSPEEYTSAVDKRDWYGTPLSGVYCIDLDKSLLAVSSSLREWKVYGLNELCAAAEQACGASFTGDITDQMRTAFQKQLDRVELLPYDTLEFYTWRN